MSWPAPCCTAVERAQTPRRRGRALTRRSAPDMLAAGTGRQGTGRGWTRTGSGGAGAGPADLARHGPGRTPGRRDHQPERLVTDAERRPWCASAMTFPSTRSCASTNWPPAGPPMPPGSRLRFLYHEPGRCDRLCRWPHHDGRGPARARAPGAGTRPAHAGPPRDFPRHLRGRPCVSGVQTLRDYAATLSMVAQPIAQGWVTSWTRRPNLRLRRADHHGLRPQRPIAREFPA